MYNKIIGAIAIVVTILLCSNGSTAQENLWSSARPDGHAPVGVMGDHYHKKGELMFSYRYMPMWMEGSLNDSDEVSDSDIYDSYMIAPQKMQMGMQMLGMMYAPSDRVTLMLMANYIFNSMDLKTGMGVEFTTESGGLGDVTIGGLVKLYNKNRKSLHANIGVSIPTGDIDQRDTTPMMDDAQLAYPMQVGSGTWDPSIGVTCLGQTDKLSWGSQSKYKFRLGENSENYTLGNRFDFVSWGAVKVSDQVSFSTSVSYFNTQEIAGVDADMNPMMMPLFNTLNSGRSQLDLGLGSNFLITQGSLKNLRFSAEVKIPVYQKVNGTQMKNSLAATFGIQYAIGHKH